MEYGSEQYDQVDFSSADEMGIDLGQYQYEGSNMGWENGADLVNDDWRENKIRL